MLTSVMPATYQCQKLLTKSLMEIPCFLGLLPDHSIVLPEGQLRRLVKTGLVAA
jgi:hypothetical protein